MLWIPRLHSFVPERLFLLDQALALTVGSRSIFKCRDGPLASAHAVNLVFDFEQTLDHIVIAFKSLRPLSHSCLKIPGENLPFHISCHQLFTVEQHGANRAPMPSQHMHCFARSLSLPDVDVRIETVRVKVSIVRGNGQLLFVKLLQVGGICLIKRVLVYSFDYLFLNVDFVRQNALISTDCGNETGTD